MGHFGRRVLGVGLLDGGDVAMNTHYEYSCGCVVDDTDLETTYEPPLRCPNCDGVGKFMAVIHSDEDLAPARQPESAADIINGDGKP